MEPKHETALYAQARADLRAIRAYIAQTLANPQAAERIAKRVLQSCQRLKAHQQLGPEPAGKLRTKADVRYLVSGNYLVFYRVETEYVSVRRILAIVEWAADAA